MKLDSQCRQTTAGQVLKNIYDQVDDPKHFMLTNRIVMALSNLRNLGRVGDVDEILRSQASQDGIRNGDKLFPCPRFYMGNPRSWDL